MKVPRLLPRLRQTAADEAQIDVEIAETPQQAGYLIVHTGPNRRQRRALNKNYRRKTRKKLFKWR